MRKLMAVLLVAILAACSGSTPTAWMGQGQTFDQAADAAVAEFWKATVHQLLMPAGAQVAFAYDNGGQPADGVVYSMPDGTWWRMPASAVSAPTVEGTLPFDEFVQSDMYDDNQNSWNCDPAAEISYVCRWDGFRWRCVIDWGACGGYGMDD